MTDDIEAVIARVSTLPLVLDHSDVLALTRHLRALTRHIDVITAERDEARAQASLRDQRDADLQSIMATNNALLAEVARLREALTGLVEFACSDVEPDCNEAGNKLNALLQSARTALSAPEGEGK